MRRRCGLGDFRVARQLLSALPLLDATPSASPTLQLSLALAQPLV